MIPESNDVKLLIYGKYIVQVSFPKPFHPDFHFQITCAFRCNGIWPRSANHWPAAHIQWPNADIAKEVRVEGFDLLSKELCANSIQQGKQQNQNPQNSTNMMEGDAWVINMNHAEKLLLSHINRSRVYSILKTLRDRHLDFPGSAVTNYLIKVSQKSESERSILSYTYKH